MIFLFSIFIVLVQSTNTHCLHYNDTNRDELLGCLSQLIDTNHDNILNATEINNFNNVCCSTWPNTEMSPNDYFQMSCDMNHDGVLDLYDWNHRHACGRGHYSMLKFCLFCYEHGWTGPPTK
jgi:hypothetical protein